VKLSQFKDPQTKLPVTSVSSSVLPTA